MNRNLSQSRLARDGVGGALLFGNLIEKIEAGNINLPDNNDC
jgi:hypothetical protein